MFRPIMVIFSVFSETLIPNVVLSTSNCARVLNIGLKMIKFGLKIKLPYYGRPLHKAIFYEDMVEYINKIPENVVVS